MTADFTGKIFHLPPGIAQAPRLIDPPADAVELDLAVAGKTIVPAEIGAPWSSITQTVLE